MAEDMIRCEPDDPRRCQGTAKGDQCIFRACEGGDKCPMHGGRQQQHAAEQKRIRNYRLAEWHYRQQLTDKSNSDDIKSLRDEVGLLRLLMEERLLKINDSNDLLLQSHAISDLVLKIEKVVSSCHKLEKSSGELLDKNAILQFAMEVVEIISTVFKGQEEKIRLVSDQIVAAVISRNEDDS